MKLNEVRAKVYSSFGWNFLYQLSVKLINFVCGIVLARLLIPEDFGVMAMVAILIGFAEIELRIKFEILFVDNPASIRA